MLNKLNKEFINKLQYIYSTNDIKLIEEGFKVLKRKTVFRTNTLKSNNEEIEKVLLEKNIKFRKVDFLSNAYILEVAVEKVLWDLDIFKDGKIYLQSLSSQLPVEFLDLKECDKVLDITAAPGGKTSQISAKLNNTGEVVANDNNAIRIDKLNFTIKRQGCKNVVVIKNDARNIVKEYPKYNGYFDKIVADLPCSAEGKFNLNIEKSYAYWKNEVVNKNYKLQKEIIKNTIPLLKDGGELIYSTCTISPEENEAMVHMILCGFPEMKICDISLDYEYARAGIKKYNNTVYKADVTKSIRIIPSDESEGFFIAKFKKTND
ncbi:MAG: RsmB/NOP family class I SAM-dependent RNA methyltransferase [Candidatus Gracilibacteria bacterium]|nr:RsmB/NOP family class I SAM-dependent RNA methyltransferase [Candidatus Gracilibacteria bacterium]